MFNLYSTVTVIIADISSKEKHICYAEIKYEYKSSQNLQILPLDFDIGHEATWDVSFSH